MVVGENIEVHSVAGPEARLGDAVGDKADLLVEAERVTVCGHVDACQPAVSGVGDSVEHKYSTDSLLHPVRVDKEVVEFADLPGDQHGREADDSIVNDGDSNAVLVNRKIRQGERVRMCQEVRAIAFVRQRRPSKQLAQCRCIGDHGEPNRHLGHSHIVPVRVREAKTGPSGSRATILGSIGRKSGRDVGNVPGECSEAWLRFDAA